MNYLKNDSIIACSSGINGAIAVIRISGNDLSPFMPLFSRKITRPRYAYYTDIIDNQEVIDRIILIYYASPQSYTGEDVLELMIHGNPINLKRIISIFTKLGARPADPGEFTYRALKNNKMSLPEVEGLNQVINASSGILLQSGMKALRGELGKSYQNLTQDFINFKAAIEVAIDFSEDVGELNSQNNILKTYNKLRQNIYELKERSKFSLKGLTDLKIVIHGNVNVGKSTLFNRLLKFNRSIISDTPGTTRDYISETLNINGDDFTLIDTAGIRETENLIEQEGINKGQTLLENAFFKLLVVDANALEKIDTSSYDLVIYSHAIRDECRKWHFDLRCDDLSSILQEIHCKYLKLRDLNIITIERHRQIIDRFFTFFNKLDIDTEDLAIVAQSVNLMEKELHQLMGIIRPDEVLNNIFDNFCIGK